MAAADRMNHIPTQPLIDEGQMTIASLLRDAGYATAMVGKWHLGFAEDGYDKPLPGGLVDRGFQSFFGIRASTDIPHYFYIRIDRPGSGGFSKSPKPQPGDPPAQLYNLRDDPAERNNLYQKHPDRVAELARLMKGIVDSPASRSWSPRLPEN